MRVESASGLLSKWPAPTAPSLSIKKGVPIWPANQRKLATASGVRITSPAVPVYHANASLVHQPSTLVIAVIRRALVLIGPHLSALRRPLSALSDCAHHCAAASPKSNTPPVLHSQADWPCNLISHLFFFPSSNSFAHLPPPSLLSFPIFASPLVVTAASRVCTLDSQCQIIAVRAFIHNNRGTARNPILNIHPSNSRGTPKTIIT